MTLTGETVTGAPVFACAWCLTISAKGKPNNVLRVPETPLWRGDPTKNPHGRKSRQERRVERWRD